MPQHRTAHEAAIKHLYHYQEFQPEWLLTVVRDHMLHCSDPARVNDPWDCRPWFSDREIQISEKLELLLPWLGTLPEPPPRLETCFDTPTKAAYVSYHSRHADDLRRLIENFSTLPQALMKTLRLYCLGPDP